MKETVLITGGAGFIGSHVAKHCLDLGFQVVIVDDLSGGFEENMPLGEDCIHKGCSILEVEALEYIFSVHKPKYVYHLAAYAAEGLSHFIRSFNYQNNLVGSMNIINACVNHDVKCLVFTSSIAVMANGTPPYTENEPFRPADPYGIAKAAVEQDLHCALEMFGLNYIVFRPFNVYGPGQNIGDKYRNVIGIFMNQIMNNQPLTVFGNGDQKRAFSYIDDVAPYIAKAATMEDIYNHVFYIGGSQPYSINELIKVICMEFDNYPAIHYLQERHEAKVAYALTEKFNQVFNPTCHSLSAGIQKMAAWAREVGPRKSKEFDNIEIRKNLPEGW
jgi:UDP-glucose 4-epimerase